MDRIAVGRRSELDAQLFTKLLRYRYQVFVRSLGWRMVTRSLHPGYEQDEFDTDATVYVVALDAQESVVGCARLLPTTRPYLLPTLLPQLAVDLAGRTSTRTWELSRFACSASQSEGNHVPWAAAIFAEALSTARRMGAHDVIGGLSESMERFCRSLGLTLCRLAAPALFDGARVVACSLDLAMHERWIDRHIAPLARATTRSCIECPRHDALASAPTDPSASPSWSTPSPRSSYP